MPKGLVTTDLNYAINPGVYSIVNTTIQVNNSPVSYGVLIVFVTDYSYLYQMVLSSANVIYHRFGEGNNWTNWRKVTSTDM